MKLKTRVFNNFSISAIVSRCHTESHDKKTPNDNEPQVKLIPQHAESAEEELRGNYTPA